MHGRYLNIALCWIAASPRVGCVVSCALSHTVFAVGAMMLLCGLGISAQGDIVAWRDRLNVTWGNPHLRDPLLSHLAALSIEPSVYEAGMNLPRLSDVDVLSSLSQYRRLIVIADIHLESFDSSLGTIGGGNHFAELQVWTSKRLYLFTGVD